MHDRAAACVTDSALDGDDGRTRLATLAADLSDAATATLWAQWAAVGASAASERCARSIVDVEALVLASLAFAGREPRLAALAHDWVAVNADLLSVQRLGNLAPAFSDVGDALRALAHTAATRAKDARWRALARGAAAQHIDAPAGTRRGTKVRAVRAPVNAPPALMLRLRLVLGVGIKADVLTFALGAAPQPAVTVRAMAKATGYSDAAVRRAADDLAAARVVDARREDGATRYAAEPRRWGGLLAMPPRFPPWRSWQARYACVDAVVAWNEATRATDRPLSVYAFGVRARELAVAHADALSSIEPAHGALPAVHATDVASVARRFERFAQTFERDT